MESRAQVGSTTFRKDIPVETVVPYKIKVDVDAPKVVDINETGNFEIKIASDYLFGAPEVTWDSTVNCK